MAFAICSMMAGVEHELPVSISMMSDMGFSFGSDGYCLRKVVGHNMPRVG